MLTYAANFKYEFPFETIQKEETRGKSEWCGMWHTLHFKEENKCKCKAESRDEKGRDALCQRNHCAMRVTN